MPFSSIDEMQGYALREQNQAKLLKKQQKVQQQIQSSQPPPDKKYLPLPEKDPGFENFCRFLSYPEYGGLFAWQKEHHRLTWEAKFEMTCVHRKAGKSVLYNNKYQWAIQYQNFDVLLLGWTAKYKEIAVYVYNFFEFYGQIEQDKRTSPFHFKTKNGGRFDAFLITSKETLGMHSEGVQDRFEQMTDKDWEEYRDMFKDNTNFATDENRFLTESEIKDYVKSRQGTHRKLWISIDDPIDITFMKERHKESTLELHFNSTLYGIQPEKWSFTGTRKFEGDFFDFIMLKFKEELVKYIRGIWNLDNTTLLCPEMFTHPSVPSYKEDLKLKEKKKKEDLEKVRKHVGEYVWNSDFMQSPKPVKGQVFTSVMQVNMIQDPVVSFYDMCVLGFDRATTRKEEAEQKKADYTGFLIGMRELYTGILTITHDFTDYIDIDKLILKVNKFVKEFRDRHEHITIILVIETQGGGQDFITLIRNSVGFVDEKGQLVNNWIREICKIIEVHNTGEKLTRIQDRLLAPINNKIVQLLSMLKDSPLYNQIIGFPNTDKVDAIDCLANMVFVLLEQYPIVKEGTSRIDELTKIYKDYEQGKLKDPLVDMNKSKFEFPTDDDWERRLGVRKYTKKYVF
jgi:hypothetical protein